MSHTSDSQGTSSCTNLSAEIDYLQLVPIHSQIKYYRVAHLDGAPHAIYGIHMQFWNPCTDPDLRLQPFLPSKDTTTLRIKNTHQQISEYGWPPNLEHTDETELAEDEEETIDCYVEKRYSQCLKLFRTIQKTEDDKLRLLKFDDKFFSPFTKNYRRMFNQRRKDLTEFFSSMCNEHIQFSRQSMKLIVDFFEVSKFRPAFNSLEIDKSITHSLEKIFGLLPEHDSESSGKNSSFS